MRKRTVIWIGTSGWVYPHWVGRFYPPDLPVHLYLAYYARHFPTVEINRSFYRLPSREQFQAWAGQVEPYPTFCFAVKASRYITHLKKLRQTEEGGSRLIQAAEGLGTHLGPILYQLPPHWHADLARMEAFLASLPPKHQSVFEFRDPTWFEPATLNALERLLSLASGSLAVGVGGPFPTPLDVPAIGPIRYLRFHQGAEGSGFAEAELQFWAERLVNDAMAGRECYVYFNNDAEGYALHDAFRLRALLEREAVSLA